MQVLRPGEATNEEWKALEQEKDAKFADVEITDDQMYDALDRWGTRDYFSFDLGGRTYDEVSRKNKVAYSLT